MFSNSADFKETKTSRGYIEPFFETRILLLVVYTSSLDKALNIVKTPEHNY